MITRLSVAQMSHLRELARFGCELSIDGFDASEAPVVSRRDLHGWRRYAIACSGAGDDAVGTVRPLTSKEVDAFDHDQFEVLLHLGYRHKED